MGGGRWAVGGGRWAVGGGRGRVGGGWGAVDGEGWRPTYRFRRFLTSTLSSSRTTILRASSRVACDCCAWSASREGPRLANDSVALRPGSGLPIYLWLGVVVVVGGDGDGGVDAAGWRMIVGRLYGVILHGGLRLASAGDGRLSW